MSTQSRKQFRRDAARTRFPCEGCQRELPGTHHYGGFSPDGDAPGRTWRQLCRDCARKHGKTKALAVPPGCR